jgi:hypothetical protein
MSDYTTTKVYANLIDGYNAGTANDEQARDRIISRGNQALYEDCKGYNAVTSKKGPYTGYDKNVNSTTDQLFNVYKNDVEFVNSFQEQVRDDEKRYFEQKYGPTVYKYLINKRLEYNNEIDVFINDQKFPTCPDTKKECKDEINKNDEINLQNFKDLYNKISQFYPSVNSNTTYRKIEYRDKEHELLMTINSIINIIYYVLLFFMVILLASSNKLLIKERFLIYLLLLVLPFLYPYIFNFFKKILDGFFVGKELHGPKNAFVELPPPNIDAYDN